MALKTNPWIALQIGDAEFITGATSPSLSNERVLTDTPTVDFDLGTAGQAKAATIPAGILAQILTVDGSGSGLDSDLLDGQHAAAFQAAGNYITALTGDVTASGPGSAAATIANNAVTTVKILDAAVTLAKLANIADATLLGNNTGGASAPVALTASQARTLLGLVIGTNVQAFDATLTSLAALGTAADKMPYTTGVDAWAEASVTAAARTVLDDTTVSAMIDTLGGASAQGSGGIVRATSPTLTTPVLGVASCTSMDFGNGVVADLFYGKTDVTGVNVANAPTIGTTRLIWQRVGNTVGVSGFCTFTPTAGGTLTQIGIPLPVASNINNNCFGTATNIVSTTREAGTIGSDNTADRAQLNIFSIGTGSQSALFSFSYEVA